MKDKNISKNYLAEGIRNGERNALLEFYDLYANFFRKTLIYKGLSPKVAEDVAVTIADDICLKVINGKFKFGIDANFNAWVHVVFKNMFIDWKRKNPKQYSLHEGMGSHQALFHSTEINSIIVQAVRSGLEKLSTMDREVILL